MGSTIPDPEIACIDLFQLLDDFRYDLLDAEIARSRVMRTLAWACWLVAVDSPGELSADTGRVTLT